MKKFVDIDEVAKIFYDYDPDMPVYDLLSYVKIYDIETKKNNIDIDKVNIVNKEYKK